MQVDKLEEFARDPIVLGEDVTPLDGFQLLTGASNIG
jgi:hypothetical protein